MSCWSEGPGIRKRLQDGKESTNQEEIFWIFKDFYKNPENFFLVCGFF